MRSDLEGALSELAFLNLIEGIHIRFILMIENLLKMFEGVLLFASKSW